MKKRIAMLLVLTLCCGMFGCAAQNAQPTAQPATQPATQPPVQTEPTAPKAEPLTAEKKGATAITRKINEDVYELLDFEDQQEKEFSERGFIAAPDSLVIKDPQGNVVFSRDAFQFVVDEKAPDTANPSLWRNTQLNANFGLYQVKEGIYQVRGYDISNLTFVKSDHGWIIMDCLTSEYTARAALELFESQMGKANIVAVIISHAHVDHYGGIQGLLTKEQVADPALPLEQQIASGKTAIIVPEGLEESVMSENVFVGTAMKRRSMYQYGSALGKGAQGSLAVGIGLGVAQGGVGYLSPTFEVKEPIFETTIDGVKAIFQLTPDTESPAEMNTYFPDSKALWLAENCTGTMHNLYTLRGAQVRDANGWARYITKAQTLFGNDAEVVFQSHNWPHWGNEVIQEYMTNTAAVYKFIHDQTLLYVNEGYTPTEISEMIQLPEALEKVWYTRQYYGTLKHNVKAVYQKYMGWYDANPVNLDELSPSEYAKKLVEYLADVDKVMEMARADFEKGEYQWVAQITNALVFADPGNQQARYLCADALEQLGYQAESGAWRNAYLVGAFELRNGTGLYPKGDTLGVGATAQGMDAQTMLDYMGIMLDTDQMADESFTINLILTNDEKYLLKVHNGVLLYYADQQDDNAAFTVTTARVGILAMAANNTEMLSKLVTVQGDTELFQKFCDSMAKLELYFPIIEP